MSQGPQVWEVTLVHGTWPRGLWPLALFRSRRPLWFEPNSYFRERLDSYLDLHGIVARLSAFEWSGRNSIFARDDAARSLAEKVALARRERPESKQILIGHSHGGTVCARAASYLPEELSDIRIVTLATPFIEIFPPRRRLLNLPLILAIILAAVLTAGAGTILAGRLGWTGVAPILSAGAVMAGMLALIAELFWTARGSRTAFRNRLVERLVSASSLRGLETKGTQLLVLRGIDDEAALTLAAGAIATRFSRVVMHLTFGIGLPIIMSVFILAALGFLSWRSDLVLGGALSVAALGTVAGTVSSGFAAVYGRELFFAFVDVEISSNSVPDSLAGVRVTTITRGTDADPAGRHGLYKEANCAPTLVECLSYSLSGESPVPELDRRRVVRRYSGVRLPGGEQGYLEIELGRENGESIHFS